MKSLKGKNVLVTGAASGIGKFMAGDFAREGAHVAAVDISAANLKKLEKEFKGSGLGVKIFACDITRKNEVTSTLKKIKRELGVIDVLVNNAGIVCGKAFADQTIEEFWKTMEVNFYGHVIFTKLLITDMIAKGEGHIVNIASSAGFLGMPNLTDYNASKFAEVGFNDALRRELKKYGHRGIKTTCVCPYVIDTGMFRGFKPVILNPILRPEYVSKKVIRAVKKEKPYLMLPASVYLTIISRILPVSVQDFLVRVSGVADAMDTYTGRTSKKK